MQALIILCLVAITSVTSDTLRSKAVNAERNFDNREISAELTLPVLPGQPYGQLPGLPILSEVYTTFLINITSWSYLPISHVNLIQSSFSSAAT
jgi:hypothetical protein